MGRADPVIKISARVEVVINPVNSGVFKFLSLPGSKKTDGTADPGIRLAFEAFDILRELVYLAVGKPYAAEPNAVPGKVLGLGGMSVAPEFFVGNKPVLIDIRLGIPGLGAVGAVLGAVSAPGIGEDLNAHHISLVFLPDCIYGIEKVREFLLGQLKDTQGVFPGQGFARRGLAGDCAHR
jgi:hypothetical protein